MPDMPHTGRTYAGCRPDITRWTLTGHGPDVGRTGASTRAAAQASNLDSKDRACASTLAADLNIVTSPTFPTFPDVLQFGGQQKPPLCGLIASNIERMPSAALRDQYVLRSFPEQKNNSGLNKTKVQRRFARINLHDSRIFKRTAVS